MRIEDTLLPLEQEFLQPATRKDPARVAALLHDDFREIGGSGRIYNKQTILEALATETPTEILMVDSQVQRLSTTVALVTYRAIRTGGHGSLRSSLWIVSDGSWRMIFHQGTGLFEES